MSEPVTPLSGAMVSGFVDLREMPVQGMVTLRGTLTNASFKKAVKSATGCDVPTQRGIQHAGAVSVAWMSPDELLILCDYVGVDEMIAKLSKALASVHFLAVNVSDARAYFELGGAAVRDVVAKLAPADLSPDAFQPGEIRRTRLAQAAAAFWMMDDSTVRIVCFRSVADYVFKLLETASAQGGEVGYY